MYTDQQSRFVRAFSNSSTSCVADCCACGRVHFVSARGHGDYSDGELERLQALAKAEPLKYIEETEFDSIDIVWIDGRQLIPDCPCGEVERFASLLDRHAEQIADYLAKLLTERRKEAERVAAEAKRMIDELEAAQAKDGWRPIRTAPKNCTRVDVKDDAGNVYDLAHWASDCSGEEQPPFEGWFVAVDGCGGGYRQIPNPSWWRPRETTSK